MVMSTQYCWVLETQEKGTDGPEPQTGQPTLCLFSVVILTVKCSEAACLGTHRGTRGGQRTAYRRQSFPCTVGVLAVEHTSAPWQAPSPTESSDAQLCV